MTQHQARVLRLVPASLRGSKPATGTSRKWRANEFATPTNLRGAAKPYENPLYRREMKPAARELNEPAARCVRKLSANDQPLAS
jgi:hypothetical protein